MGQGTDKGMSEFSASIGFGGAERAPYASDPAMTRGRLYDEPASPTRTPYQRDRDRIIHSAAFRRLSYKTQVFVFHEGDHYRSRLTHTIEVAQVSRSLARALRLDEDLAEALALGHDLGHTPFGHAGERAMHRVMTPYGGFDHNAQTLRIMTKLDRRYADFEGLNLSWETLEGLVKHNGPLIDATGRPLGVHHGEAGELPYAIRVYQERQDLRLDTYPSLEAQVAALADDIAYDSHDIDDGLRAGLIVPEQLLEAPLAGDILREVKARYGNLELLQLVQEVTRRLITRMVEDVISEALRRLAATRPDSAEAVRMAGRPLAAFSAAMAEADKGIKRFLFANVYRAPPVMAVMQDAEQVVEDLFKAFFADCSLLPAEWRRGLEAVSEPARARRVCDYIAGMTDRFALSEHRRLFDVTPDLR
jgi:dGTPase